MNFQYYNLYLTNCQENICKKITQGFAQLKMSKYHTRTESILKREPIR